MRISADGGLYISENLPDLLDTTKTAEAVETVDTSHFKPSLLPYWQWVDDQKDMHYSEKRNFYLREITGAKSAYKLNQWRQKLAQHYVAEGLHSEALSVLKRIRQTAQDFYNEQKLAAITGAAALLEHRYGEAAQYFADPSLDEVPEAKLWRAATNAILNAEADPVPYLEFRKSYIRQYPPKLQQKLAIIASDHAIRNRDFLAPLKVLAAIEEDGQAEPIGDYIAFLRGKIAAEVGRTDDAIELWTRLRDKVEDRQFRARAGYALTLLELQERKITPEEAMDQFEKLRIIWRGDDLEQSLLIALGQLYVNHNKYWKGMKTWEELLQYYPESPYAVESYRRLSDTMRHLYLDGGSNDMRPLRALALYNEFQELTPLGADGNKMLQNLVDTLVKVDLLEQAAARLETQVKYRLNGEERSLIGARLALIQLLNREPKAALETLQTSRVDDVPAALSLQRNRIAAQALLELEKPDQALVMIDGDYSSEGEALRMQAYWDKDDWANVIDIVELMLRAREDFSAPFTEAEGQHLIKLALAYLFLGEHSQLGYLRDAYAPLMEDNPYKEEFLYIAQDKVAVNNENFQNVLTAIGTAQSFISTMRERLQNSLLSETIPAGGAADASESTEPSPEPVEAETEG